MGPVASGLGGAMVWLAVTYVTFAIGAAPAVVAFVAFVAFVAVSAAEAWAAFGTVPRELTVILLPGTEPLRSRLPDNECP
jgi:hypothetical protein